MDFHANTLLAAFGDTLFGMPISAQSWRNINIELPISLMNSDFLLGSIKDNVVIRVKWKNKILCNKVGDTNVVLDSQIGVYDLQMYLRCNQVSNNQISKILSQPKQTHLFNKWVVNKYILNNLTTNQLLQYFFQTLCWKQRISLRTPK